MIGRYEHRPGTGFFSSAARAGFAGKDRCERGEMAVYNVPQLVIK